MLGDGLAGCRCAGPGLSRTALFLHIIGGTVIDKYGKKAKEGRNGWDRWKTYFKGLVVTMHTAFFHTAQDIQKGYMLRN